MRERLGATVVILLIAATAACRESRTAASREASPAHGDHIPKFGGVVLMNGDLHFEVVLDPGGRHRVYFSDAIRTPLPASAADEVVIEIRRPGQEPERLPLRPDESDEAWVAEGEPVTDENAVARITYSMDGAPYWIDLPFLAATSPHLVPGLQDPH